MNSHRRDHEFHLAHSIEFFDDHPQQLGRSLLVSRPNRLYARARSEDGRLFHTLACDKVKVTLSKIHDMLGVPFGGYSLFDLDEREVDHEFVRKWAGQFYPLELKKVRVNDIAQKLIAAHEFDFLFKVNFLTLFTNTMGKADGLKGQICLDVVRRLREDFVISDIDWCGYIYDCLRDSKLPGGTNHYLGPLTFLIIFMMNETKLRCKNLKVLLVFWKLLRKRVILEDYMRKASLKCPGNGKFVALHEKHVNLFKDLISFKDDGNGDNVGDDDDENRDDDGGNVDNDANDCDGNRDKEDVNEGDKDPNGSNLSFGFSKISLENFGNDSGLAEKDKVVEGNPTEQGTVVERNEAEECETMSTPENFTQWLEKNVNLVGEVIDSITAEYLYGDLFGDNSATLEAMNQEITPEKLKDNKDNILLIILSGREPDTQTGAKIFKQRCRETFGEDISILVARRQIDNTNIITIYQGGSRLRRIPVSISIPNEGGGSGSIKLKTEVHSTPDVPQDTFKGSKVRLPWVMHVETNMLNGIR
nr:hypothetical protein [Tanacetum cinerariifolium]